MTISSFARVMATLNLEQRNLVDESAEFRHTHSSQCRDLPFRLADEPHPVVSVTREEPVARSNAGQDDAAELGTLIRLIKIHMHRDLIS
jgi:hypothetical protein